MNPNSVLSINAVEGFPLEDFSIEAVRSQLTEAQKVASGNGSATEIAEANIEIEVSTYTILYNLHSLHRLAEVDGLLTGDKIRFWRVCRLRSSNPSDCLR